MTKTLLIDGENLFRIGFHGAKDLFSNGEHIGGTFYFLNTVRKFLEEHNHDKVIVFWDGENNSSLRKLLYPQYKGQRRNDMNEYKYESFLSQKSRVKEYLEEVFIRQCEVHGNEADDLISYYCQIAKDEEIIIFSNDKDLSQIISKFVTIYSPTLKKYFGYGDKVSINKVDIHHENVMICKVLVGDKSDNIEGIENLGEKTLVKFFPELRDKSFTIDEILFNARDIVQNKKSKALENLLTGKTKSGIFGEEFFKLNKKIIDLSNPLITEEGRKNVEMIYSESLDPTDRGYKNLMRMMIDDGLFHYLPKDDDEWVNFMKPFTKLIRKEKKIN